MISNRARILAPALALLAWLVGNSHAVGQIRLKDICHVKGQEENTINGIGLVFGLKGTGDGGSYLPTMRSLATLMEFMGNPIGQANLLELKDAKNVAVVMVTAVIPEAGARQGSRIDCSVSSIGAAKSLAGGVLFATPLLGPDPKSDRVFAFASGEIRLEDIQFPNSGLVHHGAQLEEEFRHEYVSEGKITLVLDDEYADFEVSTEISQLINVEMKSESAGGGEVAEALDQVNIEIAIPSQYTEAPAQFVSQVLAIRVAEPQAAAKVVINERAGSVVIDGDVEIGAVIVHHKNIVIETGDNLPVDRFPIVDPRGTGATKLKALVAALNAVKVPPADVIEIIKQLKADGNLYGRLIVQ